jgi:hypothetical protein
MNAKRIATFVILTLTCALFGSSEGAVVLNQIGDVDAYLFGAAPGPTPSQIFTDFPTCDCTLLEDFTVASTELNIIHVTALFRAQGGYSSFQDVAGYDLNIFSAANLAATSLVGDVASQVVFAAFGAAVTQVVDAGSSEEYGLVSLAVDVALPGAGTYWLGVSPRSAVAATGQFLLMNSGASGEVTPGNANAQLANPGEGLGAGAISSLNLDYAYAITAIPEPAVSMLWILASCAWLCRRQRTRKA